MRQRGREKRETMGGEGRAKVERDRERKERRWRDRERRSWREGDPLCYSRGRQLGLESSVVVLLRFRLPPLPAAVQLIGCVYQEREWYCWRGYLDRETRER